MLDDETAATIKITFDDVSPEWKSFMYTIQAFVISVTMYTSLNCIYTLSKTIKNVINRTDYNRI